MINEHFVSKSEEETIQLGQEFAKKLHRGDSVSFYGDLGSGKTEFIKGICRQLKVDELVSSPTFTIINQYLGSLDNVEIPIYHIDLYRIKNHEELENIGFEECIHTHNGIKLIEWAQKANGDLPKKGYRVEIKTDQQDEDLRHIDISFNY